ncbi:conserved hypothetical protein [Ricinus communis]|uniref:Uncharacterized protein n=1 Tax=Ricinus communis TaxID=3988 RepID=B9S417_RICCO|nr:conserved hypothetical protein [Ricinus communis]
MGSFSATSMIATPLPHSGLPTDYGPPVWNDTNGGDLALDLEAQDRWFGAASARQSDPSISYMRAIGLRSPVGGSACVA